MARRSDVMVSRLIWVIRAFLTLLVVPPFLLIGLIIGGPSSRATPLKELGESGHIIGIDFGSSYSRVGVIRNGTMVVIPNVQGQYETPTYVAFNGSEILVGETARQKSTEKPDSAIQGFKHLLGLHWSDKAFEHAMLESPMIIKNQANWPVFDFDDAGKRRSFTTHETTALVLGKMKNVAEGFLEEEVTGAVVAVPAAFNDAQRQAIKDAGSIAGLNVIRVVNEPTSAVLAYGLDRFYGKRHILVIDIGGGTLDVSLLKLDCRVVEVLATTSDMSLGGQTFNERMIDNVSQRLGKLYNIDITRNVTAMARLSREVGKAKIALSTHQETVIRLDGLLPSVNVRQFFTRAQFEEITESLRDRTMETITNVLRDNDISKECIHDVLLIGGSAHIPSIRTMLKAAFNGKISVNDAIQPDEAVVHGAAIQAPQDFIRPPICGTRLSLGVETTGGIMAQIVPRDVAIPTLCTATFTIVGNDDDIVTVRVFEGERPLTKDNFLLGSFDLKYSTATAERPDVEVTFFIFPNGVVGVAALDDIMIIENASTRLSDQEIEERISTAALQPDADNELMARLATNVDDNREREDRSELMYLPEDQTNDVNGDISDEPQWEWKTWLSSVISGANKAGRGYLNWLGGREKFLRQEAEQDEL